MSGGEGRRLVGKELRWRCPRLGSLQKRLERDAESAPGVDPKLQRALRLPIAVKDFVGQERAIETLRSGLTLAGPNFHLFVVGPEGSGRHSLLRALIEDIGELPLPRRRDRVLVHRFRANGPGKTMLITLPRGKGRRFRRDLEDLLLICRRLLRSVFESDETVRRRDRLLKRQEQREKDLFGGLIERAGQKGFRLPSPSDGELLFKIDRHSYSRGRLLDAIERGALKVPGLARKLKEHEQLRAELRELQAKGRAVLRGTPRALSQLERGAVERAIGSYLSDLAQSYPTPAVERYLAGYLHGLVQNIGYFINEDEEEDAGIEGLFRANLVVDASSLGTCPWVEQPQLNEKSLLGGTDSEHPGEAPDFLKLRAGALLEAEGRVLILPARELLGCLSAWKQLRECLLTGRFPLPIELGVRDYPLGCKVVIVGSQEDYHHLIEHEAVAAAFGIKVELELGLERGGPQLRRMGLALRDLALRHGLRAPDVTALRGLFEIASRWSDRPGRLSLCFGPLLALLREADGHAAARGAESVQNLDVQAALDARRSRHSQHERYTQALISDGVVLIDTKGTRIGQVNGLVIYEGGDESFARPCRLTASVSLGWRGVIDIECESRLSGETHHKGVQILSGLLRQRYAWDKPLVLTAALCFEQSYSPIDGDSASAAEAIAILSAIAEAPIKQGLSLSGSINQRGDLQAIGGVNEKIEGFFDACRATELNGEQGVVIPAANVHELMLREDVVTAIEEGRFHVYAASTLDDAVRLMLDLEPGLRGPSGYSAASLNGRVDRRLRQFAETWRDFRAQEARSD